MPHIILNVARIVISIVAIVYILKKWNSRGER